MYALSCGFIRYMARSVPVSISEQVRRVTHSGDQVETEASLVFPGLSRPVPRHLVLGCLPDLPRAATGRVASSAQRIIIKIRLHRHAPIPADMATPSRTLKYRQPAFKITYHCLLPCGACPFSHRIASAQHKSAKRVSRSTGGLLARVLWSSAYCTLPGRIL